MGPLSAFTPHGSVRGAEGAGALRLRYLVLLAGGMFQSWHWREDRDIVLPMGIVY